MGSALAMITNQYIYERFPTYTDPARLGAQVISGIGFLGAGTIILTGRQQVKGLTTAAGLWASACMGLAIGIGFYSGAILGCFFILVSMTALHKLDNIMQSKTRILDLYIQFDDAIYIGSFLNYLRQKNITVSDMQIHKNKGNGEGGMMIVFMTIKTKQRVPHSGNNTRTKQGKRGRSNRRNIAYQRKKRVVKLMLNDSIKTLPGIGEARAKLFEKLGIYSINDLLHHYPRDYQDRTNVKKISELKDGEMVCIIAIPITKVTSVRLKGRMSMQKLQVSDETGRLTVIWFNQPYLKKSFDTKNEYVFYGKVYYKYGRVEMLKPTFEGVKEERFTRKIIPIYPSSEGISQKMIQSAVQNCINQVDYVKETLPDDILKKYNLCGIQYAIKNIHLPDDFSAYKKAHRRLAFEELFTLQLSIRKIKEEKQKKKGYALTNLSGLDEMIKSLPFSLTNAQKRVVNEIISDLKKDIPMSRLLQGDVGSGKTIIAAIAIFIANKMGCKRH